MQFHCSKCNKEFDVKSKYLRHINKKISCDRRFKCEKCGKEFSSSYLYDRHSNRKTSCVIIQGNPLEEKTDNQCQYCYKSYKFLKKHYKKCKILNGGFGILVKKLNDLQQNEVSKQEEIERLKKITEQQQEEMNKLKKQIITTSSSPIININIQYIEHYTNNRNFLNFHEFARTYGPSSEIIINTVKEKFQKGVFNNLLDNREFSKIMVEMAQSIYRNKNIPEGQCIIVDDESAYIYGVDGKKSWYKNSFSKVYPIILESIQMSLPDIPEYDAKIADVHKIILSNCSLSNSSNNIHKDYTNKIYENDLSSINNREYGYNEKILAKKAVGELLSIHTLIDIQQ